MSEPTTTKRRDSDPVRVYADARVAYWSGGKPGLGRRVFERHADLMAADARAQELRERFGSRLFGRAPSQDATLTDLMRAFVAQLEAAGDPQGTVRKYRSTWNCWIGGEVGHVPCRDAELHHWTAVFDSATAAGASLDIVTAIATALGALMSFGVQRSFFVTNEGFAFSPRRTQVTADAKQRAKRKGKRRKLRILLEHCPTADDIEEYAEAFEVEYPGYGRRLVLLAFASGLRIKELLALRVESIDLTTGEIAVDWQLDRYQQWPALAPPKGGKTRTAVIWGSYLHVARSLVRDAQRREHDRGWLFPRHRSETRWADQAGKLATAAARRCDWGWSFHWTRHAWATWSLAPVSEGGGGRPVESVSAWLGHARTSVTQDTYVQRQANDVELFAQATQHRPGTRPTAGATPSRRQTAQASSGRGRQASSRADSSATVRRQPGTAAARSRRSSGTA